MATGLLLIRLPVLIKVSYIKKLLQEFKLILQQLFLMDYFLIFKTFSIGSRLER